MKYTLSEKEVLRYLGYHGQAIDAELRARIDDVRNRCSSELQPAGTSALFPVDATRLDAQGVPCISLVGSTLVFQGADIYRHLEQAQYAAIMACTLGVKSEQMLQRLSSTDPLAALICDASCTALIESAADALEADIVHEAADRGLFTNFRYSPGYGDFPLDIQSDFLCCLDAQRRIGLTATESNFLLPTKSVTAVVGLFTSPQESSKRGCAQCNCKDYCTIKISGSTCYERKNNL